MINIRDATVDDVETIIALGEQMHIECLEFYPPIDPEHTRKYLTMAVTAEFFLVALAEDNGLPVGFTMAVAGPYAFSPALRASSDILFVLPSRRGGSAAIRLVERFKEWADEMGVGSATMSVATGIAPERTGRFFQFMGFRPMEMIYRRDNVHGS